MKHFVKKRDGPARLKELQIKNKTVETPNIVFINTKRFPAPNHAELTISNNKKNDLIISEYFIYPESSPNNLQKTILNNNINKEEDYSIIPGKQDLIDTALKNNDTNLLIIGNAAQLFKHAKKFVDYIVYLKEKINDQKIIYLPAVGNPINLALLTYLGIDLFDSTQAITTARNNQLFLPHGIYHKNDLKEIPCLCPSCLHYRDKTSDISFKNILEHNYYMFLNEIKNIRNHINHGNLRDLVEKQVKNNPHLTAILRYLDKEYYNFLEKQTPVTSRNIILATSKETFNRPEIKRFQERILNRYKKPASTKILLLLPCSAKKPYSFSESHRLFREKIVSCGNPFIVHEVIITSPIGIVPREVEIVYPASSYDIPVTGVWNEDEKKMITTLLQLYLKNNKYDEIVVHLPYEIFEFTKDLLKDSTVTCIDKPTSKKSLNTLSETLKNMVNRFEKMDSKKRKVEDVFSLACYQFGWRIAEKLMHNCTVKGRYPNEKIFHGKQQIGMIVGERGFISLTLEGGKKISGLKDYNVEVYDDFQLKGSVFAPGIVNADPGIRIGDEVVVTSNKKTVGVGVALMNGDDMKQLNYGEAVKIRHHV